MPFFLFWIDMKGILYLITILNWLRALGSFLCSINGADVPIAEELTTFVTILI